MEGENERRVFRNAQVFGANGNTLLPEPLHLGNQRMRIDHHAIADDRELARPYDTGRKQAQLVADSVDDQRMSGIVATLKAHNDIGPLRQPVDDLALALVSPLRADDHHISHDPCSFASCFRPPEKSFRQQGTDPRKFSAMLGKTG